MALENYDRRQDTNFDMRALCIGGPHDGEWHLVPAHVGALATMVIAERPALRPIDDSPLVATTAVSRQTAYTVCIFVTEYRAYKLLVHPSLTMDAAFNTLMRCYGGQQ